MRDEIISARHVCLRDGTGTLKEWIRRASGQRRIGFSDLTWGLGVLAVVEGGRWIAHCIEPNCGGAEYVREDEPLFFCFSCLNRANKGHCRPVRFPAEWREIEAALLKRPTNMTSYMGLNSFEHIRNATPKIPGLARWWAPPTTVADLLEENRKAGIE